ncbi:MAG: hypothetical protein U0Q12_03205 [Vicinamibacterales bacterium]
MPYEPHANLIQSEDNNAYIWRFIDLPKFLDMLVPGSLYFTRGDMFDDPCEGMTPDEYKEAVCGSAGCAANTGSTVENRPIRACRNRALE